ncbi:Rab family GTPase [Rhodococcus aetherivorans]|uniref:Rab family GTPase n=1 Tax=Rhodococcus aetherivorans TaxID=191292 RepID=UPI00366D07A7
MTGAETVLPPIGGAAFKLIIERSAPAAFKWVRAVAKGKTIVIVGPGRTGKTTFLNYIHHGVFQHNQATNRTLVPEESKRFDLEVGPSKNLKLHVSSAIDTPGQYPDISKFVHSKRPHALIIVLDLSSNLKDPDPAKSSAAWLDEFLTRLDQRWIASRASRNRLRSVIVVLNKADLVSESTYAKHETRYRKIMKDSFRVAKGSMQQDVLYKKCIMVENPYGTKFVDAVIFDLAKSLVS